MRGPLDLVETGEGPSTLCTQAECDVGCLGNRHGRLVGKGTDLATKLVVTASDLNRETTD